LSRILLVAGRLLDQYQLGTAWPGGRAASHRFQAASGNATTRDSNVERRGVNTSADAFGILSGLQRDSLAAKCQTEAAIYLTALMGGERRWMA
jgi:hypothetical protein